MKDLTVGEYLFNKIHQSGVSEIFGVPGDYNFPLLDIIEKDKNLSFINCCNELNAGYAADGYARIKGLSALITTFGVGELSTLNTIAGAYSEDVPIIHIVGSPKSSDQMAHKLLHHTLLDGDFDVFRKMSAYITETTTILNIDNAKEEIDRVLNVAITKKKPVYILLAKDICSKNIVDKNSKAEEVFEFISNEINHLISGTNKDNSTKKYSSDKNILDSVTNEITHFINSSRNPVIISGLTVSRHKLKNKVITLCEKLNAPITTMLTGKGSFDEQHPNYIGLYCGSLMNEQTRQIVESSDCIINIGEPLGDFNCGAFSAKLNPLNIIEINGDNTKIGMAKYENVAIEDVLDEITKNINTKNCIIPKVQYKYDQVPTLLDSSLSSEYYFSRFQEFLKDGDTIIAETGTLSLGLSQVKLPSDVEFIFQAQWSSIGYATPATLGAGVASKNRRLILFTGDGAHQLTAQSIGTMGKNNLKPIIFLLNNDGYTVERYLNTQNNSYYNDIPKWDYTLLPKAFGCDAFVATVRTNKELDDVLRDIETKHNDKMCYIELIGNMMDAPLFVKGAGKIANKK